MTRPARRPAHQRPRIAPGPLRRDPRTRAPRRPPGRSQTVRRAARRADRGLVRIRRASWVAGVEQRSVESMRPPVGRDSTPPCPPTPDVVEYPAMKITDVSLTLFEWRDIPPTTYGQMSRAAGTSQLGL